MEKITEIISKYSKAKTENFKKGQLLQRAGDTKPSTYFVKKGLLRSYIIDSKGKEHIFMFAPEQWIIADIEAIEFNEPVQLYIDCLEDSEVIIFNKYQLHKDDIPKEKIGENTQLLYRRLAKLQRRVIMLMSSPALERYIYFLNTYPELPNRVPQKMIASYLGIAPQTLSNLRKQIVQKK